MAETVPQGSPPMAAPMPDPGPESGADVVIEDKRWREAGLDALAARAVAAALDHLGRTGSMVAVLGCNDARIAALNADFRGHPRPTNVLSWPAVEHSPHAPGALPDVPDVDELGDIAISYETCVAEADAQGKPFADHVSHLLIHATLHLAGFDHDNPRDAETMEQAERSILSGLGIPDPYDDDRPE